MNEVLQNLANLHLLRFCKEYNIDPSDSFVVKTGRGFAYSLCDYRSRKPFVSLVFQKSATPIFTVHSAERSGSR